MFPFIICSGHIIIGGRVVARPVGAERARRREGRAAQDERAPLGVRTLHPRDRRLQLLQPVPARGEHIFRRKRRASMNAAWSTPSSAHECSAIEQRDALSGPEHLRLKDAESTRVLLLGQLAHPVKCRPETRKFALQCARVSCCGLQSCPRTHTCTHRRRGHGMKVVVKAGIVASRQRQSRRVKALATGHVGGRVRVEGHASIGGGARGRGFAADAVAEGA